MNRLFSLPNFLFLILYLMVISPELRAHGYSILILARALGICLVPFLAGVLYNTTKTESKIIKYLYLSLTTLFIFIDYFASLQTAKENLLSLAELTLLS